MPAQEEGREERREEERRGERSRCAAVSFISSSPAHAGRHLLKAALDSRASSTHSLTPCVRACVCVFIQVSLRCNVPEREKNTKGEVRVKGLSLEKNKNT